MARQLLTKEGHFRRVIISCLHYVTNNCTVHDTYHNPRDAAPAGTTPRLGGQPALRDM